MNPPSIATAAVVLMVGVAIGYKVAEKRLTTEFEERLERETNMIRRMYKPDVNSPQEMVQDLHGEAVEAVMADPAMEAAVRAMSEYQNPEPTAYHKIRTSEVKTYKVPEEEKIARRVFEPSDERGEIYVISAEEHAQNEPGYEQVTWNYYTKDGVMTDIHEDRIEDYTNFIGLAALISFGEQSGDENTVYVRNEIVMIDYEVVRSHGSYREEVLNEEMPAERPSQRINRGD